MQRHPFCKVRMGLSKMQVIHVVKARIDKIQWAGGLGRVGVSGWRRMLRDGVKRAGQSARNQSSR